ncbi:MAG TPA: oxygen-dependent coproporphyrinogen oxidase [Acidimicrobiia bacterium]|nr:oxygen-dependent coproporphyrinogen oxidase [Acidimicrobiia bacterium]
MTDRQQIETSYQEIQSAFCAAVEVIDGQETFGVDKWERAGGGGGITRILSGAGHVEKAAVNFSAVEGATPEALSERMAAESSRFFATGVSIIVHPRNPLAPTFHANIRYFETDTGHSWFGGGADLTPHYLFEADAAHFHRTLKTICDRHPVADYRVWKQACDEYFYLPHRGEARGIGGIFFDHLTDRLDEVRVYQRDLGHNLTDLYLPILTARVDEEHGEREREWQEVRRGRYAEFNLVWDRGTRFGLETSGRTESILASLPPRARWVYGYEPEPGSREAALLELVRAPPRDWV